MKKATRAKNAAPARSRTRTVVVATMVVMLAVTAGVSYSSFTRTPEPAPARSPEPQAKRAPLALPRLTSSQLDEARLLLRGGETKAAAGRFAALFATAEECENPRDHLAYYLGVCAEKLGDWKQAEAWYSKARDLAGADESSALGCAAAVALLPQAEYVSAFRQQDVNKEEIRKKVRAELDKVQQLYAKGDMSPGTRALLLHWRFLYAELSVDDQAKLYETSNDEFAKAFTDLSGLEKDLTGLDDLKKAVDNDPGLRAKLDIILVRLPAIVSRSVKARDKERERLQGLRDIVKEYKGTDTEAGGLGELARACTFLAAGEKKEAAAAVKKLGDSVARVKAIVEKRKDQFLFEKENETAVPTNVAPLSPTFATHLGLLQGYMLAQEASEAPDAGAALDTAAKAVEDALAVKGPEAETPFAPYVQGLIQETRGVTLTQAMPAEKKSHEDAGKHFAGARAKFDEAAALLDKKGDTAAAKALRQDALARSARLKDAKVYLDEARKLTGVGAVEDAAKLLVAGQRRHYDPELWVARAEASRRAFLQGRPGAEKEALAEINQARKSKLLPDEDYRGPLLEGKLLLARLERQLSTLSETDKVVAKNELMTDCDQAVEQLRSALKLANADLDKGFCSAYLSLALAYRQILEPDPDGKRAPLVREGYAKAKDALAAMATAPKGDLDVREARLTAALARGHLAVVIEPVYRSVALVSFGEAINEGASLPFAGKSSWTLGAPLLTELNRRPENASGLEAAELNKTAIVLSRFGDGAMALYQGQPTAAVKRMEEGLQAFRTPAARLTPDDHLDLEDRLTGHLALAQVAQREPMDAVQTVLATEDRKLRGDAAIERSAQLAAKLNNPVLAYALGRGLETYLEGKGLENDSLKSAALDGARAAHKRAADLLQSRSERDTNPGYDSLAREANERMTSPRWYISRVKEAQGLGRVEDAEKLARQGLARHPENAELWASYFETRMARVTQPGQGDAVTYQSVLKDLENLQGRSKALRYQKEFWEGVVRLRLKEWKPAEGAFLRAVALAGTTGEQVMTRSKLAEAQLADLYR